MGFFTPGDPLRTPAPAKLARTPRAAAIKPLRAEVLGCEGCSLKAQWPRILSPRMAMTGARDSDVLILGEAPGEVEDQDGLPFVVRSGKLLHSAIPARDRERIAWQNIVRCRPHGDEKPSVADVHACSVHLDDDVRDRPNIKAVLIVGGVGLSRLYPGEQITNVHGLWFPVQLGSRVVWGMGVFHPSFVAQMGGERGPAYPVFRSDVRKFFSDIDYLPAPSIIAPNILSFVYPKTLEEARATLGRMQTRRGVDIETTSLVPHSVDSRIIAASVSDGEVTMAWSIEHPESPCPWGDQLLYEAIRDPWIAHNSAFELKWFRWFANGRAIGPFDDTMGIGRCLHNRERGLSLESMSVCHLGTNVKALSPVTAKKIMNFPLSELLPYVGIDAWASAMIYQRTIERILDHRYANYKRIIETISSTVDMELDGLDVSRENLNALRTPLVTARDMAAADAAGVYEAKAFSTATGERFSVSNPDHVGKALVEFGHIELPRTPGGKQFSTDDETLKKAAPEHPLVINVLRYRGAAKLLSTYLDATDGYLKASADGRIHPGYTVMLTSTGRLSSEGPNIQNFPKRRNRELRGQIVAPFGMVFVSFDYAQLEARIMAMASKDNALCDSIITGRDIHSDWRDNVLRLYPPYYNRVADMCGEATEKEVMKAGRNVIKTDFVFASFFGASANSVSSRAGLPSAVAIELQRMLWTEFPDIQRWVKARRFEYQDTGSITTLTGRIRHGFLGGNETINTPIQGTGADIVLDSQNECAAYARENCDPVFRPRINIHDDVTFVMPDDSDLADRIETIGRICTRVRYPWQIVPLTVEASIGTQWDRLEAVGTITGDYIK